MTTALILTGAPGAGKSSVLEAVTTLLEVEGVDYSALESEQLGWGWPPLETAQWLAQLAAVMSLQREAGRRLFLVAATTETAADLRGVVDAVGAERTVVVLLVAEPDVVAARVEAREPDRWPGKRALIAHARELAVAMPSRLDQVDARIPTGGRDAEDVAVEVREVLAAALGREPPASPARRVTRERVRELALALPEATEQDHHGRPSFRVGGKIFATIWDDGHFNVMLDEPGILTAVQANRQACGEVYWGKRLAAVRVTLDQAGEALVRDLLADAWEHKAPARLRSAGRR